jgi:hypothetical protein
VVNSELETGEGGRGHESGRGEQHQSQSRVAGTGAERVHVSARGEDGRAAMERAHIGSWWGTQVVWEEGNGHEQRYIYTAQTYQQWFSTRTDVNKKISATIVN